MGGVGELGFQTKLIITSKGKLSENNIYYILSTSFRDNRK